MPKLIKGIHIRPSTKRKSYPTNSSKYRRVLSDGCDPAAKRLRGNAAVLYELDEEDRINRERESRLAAYAAYLQPASQATPSGPSFVQQSQNDSTLTVDGDNCAQNESEYGDIDPGPRIPSQAEEEMEVGEDSWTETVNQFIWEQTQKSKPKEAQSQYRTAKIVWTNKWKNIRTDLFDTYLRYKRLSDEGDIFLGIEHLNKRCKCTSTKSRDVAFIDRDNRKSQLRRLIIKPLLNAFCLFTDCYESVPFCKCIPDPVRLLARGFIAVSPDTPKTAISISLVQYFETIRGSVPMSVSGFAEELWRCHTLSGEPHSSQITQRVRAVLRSATRLMAPYVSLVMEGLFFDKLYSSFAIYFYRRRSSTERYYPLILLKSSRQSVQPVLGPVSKRICKQVIATTSSPPTAIPVTSIFHGC